MSSDNRVTIQELWADEQCPIINGIIFGDGIIKRFRLVRDNSQEGAIINLILETQTTVIDFLSQKPNNLTTLVQLCEKNVSEKHLRLIAGEGGWGGDGFVAIENKETKALEFLLFFDNSNPFVEIDFDESRVIAVSNLGERWIIPIEEPENTVIFASATK
jgi:hypothetical protein